MFQPFFNYIIILVFILIGSKTPAEHFKSKYIDAGRFYKKNIHRLQKIILLDSGDISIVLPVAFPELIRYSMWQDMLETTANELLYVKNGEPYTYFSMGMFQIKPSFAEKVELYIKRLEKDSSQFRHLYAFKSDKIKEIREERIKRLKNPFWQIRYITAFTKIVEDRFRLDKNMPLNDKIAFYCSAYNHDFLCDSLEVTKWIYKKTFPYGMKHDNPFTYSEVAVYYYNNEFQQILKKIK